MRGAVVSPVATGVGSGSLDASSLPLALSGSVSMAVTAVGGMWSGRSQAALSRAAPVFLSLVRTA